MCHLAQPFWECCCLISGRLPKSRLCSYFILVKSMAVPEVSEEVRFKSGQGDFSTVNVSPQCAVHKDSGLKPYTD